jgi:hypothetical protein
VTGQAISIETKDGWKMADKRRDDVFAASEDARLLETLRDLAQSSLVSIAEVITGDIDGETQDVIAEFVEHDTFLRKAHDDGACVSCGFDGEGNQWSRTRKGFTCGKCEHDHCPICENSWFVDESNASEPDRFCSRDCEEDAAVCLCCGNTFSKDLSEAQERRVFCGLECERRGDQRLPESAQEAR